MGYKPIEEYGVIGNMRTAALIGTDGSIDWYCYPHFDSPSVFAAILDDKKGGRFRIAPKDTRGIKQKQFYWPETNVLITRFLAERAVGQVVDYMPVGVRDGEPGSGWLIRRVRVVRGSMTFRLECQPAFDYGRAKHDVSITSEGACFGSPDLGLGLATDVSLQPEGSGVTAEFTLQHGEMACFILRELENGSCGSLLSADREFDLFDRTAEYWHRWMSQCTYTGRWREAVQRSALVLKLLTFEPTGAIVAAPTCSLPEHIGGGRNWDYRYTWIRDAAFMIYAFLRIGFTEEAARFGEFLRERIKEPNPDGSLQIMYGIDGRHELEEETLDGLEGYRKSQPVRVGNGAYNQLQLDIYGELMDGMYLFNKYGTPIGYDGWAWIRRMADYVANNWQLEDEGIWEVRGGSRNFVYSKLMCWVALDRALRLADKRSFPTGDGNWLSNRDRIYEEIFEKGWSEKRQAFVQSYGSEVLDAANLIMPLVFFTSPNDRRFLSTLDAIMEPIDQGGLLENNLVFRYNVSEADDGISGDEGTFNICTFWLVEALTRAGQRDPARLRTGRLIFEEMLGYANHLGLYAEETGPRGEALGNFPLGLTHLALISAAFNLDRALGAHD